MKPLFTVIFWMTTLCLFAQDQIPGTTEDPQKVTFSGYADAYYIYDLNSPDNGNRPGFIYSHNRHNEFNVNLAFLKANLSAHRVRANLALMAGTYANANLVAEPGVLRNIYEANAGINLSKNKQLWLDAGIFGSHIGFESAIGKDCWNMTRSMLADNSPYYEAGAKLTYTSDDGSLLASGLILNGWQRIQRVEGSSLPSFGWQVQVKPSDKILLNSSSFIGTDKPDAVRQMRYFHNFYTVINASDKLGFTLGFDTGWEETANNSGDYNFWYSPVAIARYMISERAAIAGRIEYYNDENGVIIATGTPDGFQTFGYSVNLDLIPVPNAMIRFEGRLFQSSEDDIFIDSDGQPSATNAFFGSTLAVSF